MANFTTDGPTNDDEFERLFGAKLMAEFAAVGASTDDELERLYAAELSRLRDHEAALGTRMGRLVGAAFSRLFRIGLGVGLAAAALLYTGPLAIDILSQPLATTNLLKLLGGLMLGALTLALAVGAFTAAFGEALNVGPTDNDLRELARQTARREIQRRLEDLAERERQQRIVRSRTGKAIDWSLDWLRKLFTWIWYAALTFVVVTLAVQVVTRFWSP
jgi:hypothetical protein